MVSKEPRERGVTDRGFKLLRVPSYKNLKRLADCSNVKCNVPEASGERLCWSCMAKVSGLQRRWPRAGLKNSAGSSLKKFATTRLYQGNEKMEALLTSSLCLCVGLSVVDQRSGSVRVEGARRHGRSLFSESLLDCELFKTFLLSIHHSL